jgi:pSer/pThr/pTyr-binding forkhead associated (FHA) protein
LKLKGSEVVEKKVVKNDLTTTIHLAGLRSVSEDSSALLEKATQAEKDVIGALPEGSAMLIVLSGPSRGARFLLNTSLTTIGRSPENDVFLDDVTVSRKHAEISKTGDGYQVKDLGSLNGTYVNGKVEALANLSDGMEINIGKFKMHFFIGGKVRG